MPRVGPNYTLPEPPFVPQTSISSAAMNSDLSDIADALTNSLARNGAGGMTASLPLANDGFIFQNDPDTGISRSAANTMSHECGGNEIMEVSPTGVDVTGSLSATGVIKQNGFSLLPVGVMFPYAGSAAPSGYLLCYGQAISRTTYAALFAAIGTVYGSGDGSTTFNVPDLRGRVAAGGDAMGGVAAGRLTDAVSGIDGPGDGGGAQSVTLTTAQIPSHNHTLTDPGHNHNFGGNPAYMGLGTNAVSGPGSIGAAVTSGFINTITSNATGISIAAAGGGGAHANVQPTLVTNYIIFAGV